MVVKNRINKERKVSWALDTNPCFVFRDHVKPTSILKIFNI
jgi:hypothetical protein